MTISEAQLEIRTRFVGGCYGQFVSGTLWLTSAGLAVWRGPRASIIMLVVGGFVIFPATELLIRVIGERAPVSSANALRSLGMQIAFVLPLSMPLLLPVGLYRLNRVGEGGRPRGMVAKRLDSRYEPGLRSGAWQKMRVNRGQEFVIGGYTVGGDPFDALIFGYHEKGELIYAARTRNGFYSGDTRAVVQAVQRPRDHALPVREPAGEEERALGCGADREEDG
jgi:hypothetical protein